MKPHPCQPDARISARLWMVGLVVMLTHAIYAVGLRPWPWPDTGYTTRLGAAMLLFPIGAAACGSVVVAGAVLAPVQRRLRAIGMPVCGAFAVFDVGTLSLVLFGGAWFQHVWGPV